MIQLILHLIGDYVLQSQWMAENKAKSTFAAATHAIIYSLPFLILNPSWPAFAVIIGTHFLIDRFSLAKYVVWAKNHYLQPWESKDVVQRMEFDEMNFNATDERLVAHSKQVIRYSWSNCRATGYPSDLPPWLAVWLLIAADNTLHLAINYAALAWL